LARTLHMGIHARTHVTVAARQKPKIDRKNTV
jgi:hypothetical protein